MFPFPFSFVAPVASGIGTVDNVYSMEFDGVNDYVDLGNTSDTKSESPYTISVWALKNGTGTGTFPTIISNQKNSSGQGGWAINENSNKWRAYIDTTGSGGWVYAESNATITTSQWYHLVAHWDGSTITLYVDGVAQTTTASAATIGYGTITQNATIGSYTSANYFNGKIDEIAIFNYALDSDQILEIYNATSAGPPAKTADLNTLSTPPVLWYRMGD